MSTPRGSHFVGWGGGRKHVIVDINLGMGNHRRAKSYGPRRIVWAAAMGYVSGFPKRDILYFLLTRCVSARISEWAMKREGIEFRNGIPVGKIVYPADQHGCWHGDIVGYVPCLCELNHDHDHDHAHGAKP